MIIMNYKQFTVVAFTLLMVYPILSSASPVSIPSSDGLKLTLSENGKPAGLVINGTTLPMLTVQGGFSFREVLTNPPNLLANPGFENSLRIPLNWSFVANNGNTPVWDTVAHSGARSIKINVPGTTDKRSGYPKSDFIEVDSHHNYTLSAWVKTLGVEGTNGPAVSVAELDANKKWIRTTTLVFSKGTNNWMQKQKTFQTSTNTKWVYIYADIWNGYGTFWVDDIVLNGPSNRLINPGFENSISIPLNWSLIANNGNTPILDKISRTGPYSIKISVLGTTECISGYPKSDLIRIKPLQYYTLYAWVKTQGVGGTYGPAVRLVELDANKNWLRQTNLEFDKGTANWTRKQITFQTGINTSWVYVYANIWNGYGTFWMDDVRLEQFFGPTVYLTGPLIKNDATGIVTQRTRVNDIDFTFTYVPRGRYIELHGEVQDLKGKDRALQMMYNLPVNAGGWKWGDYIRGSRVITENIYYENVYKLGETRTQSIYPFSSIYNTKQGIGIAVPMDVPRIYRMGYYLGGGSYIQYDFGLSSRTLNIRPGHANFSFIIYKIDEPEWGFRSVVKKYYELYPRFFEKRNTKEGLVAFRTDLTKINNISDFGIMFDESAIKETNNLMFDNLNNISALKYEKQYGYWRFFGDIDKPSYEERVNALIEDRNSKKITYWGPPLSELAEAIIDDTLYDVNGKMYLDEKDIFWRNWGNGGMSQLYPVNSNPDLPRPSYYNIIYNYSIPWVIAKEREGFIDGWAFGSDNFLDSKISKNGARSAKIYVPSPKAVASTQWVHDYIPVNSNTIYTFSAWGKIDNQLGSKDARVVAVQLTKNGINISTYRNIYFNNHNWIYKSINFRTNKDTTGIMIYFELRNSSSRINGTAWIDDISLIDTNSQTNLISNGGFEKNKRGEVSNYVIDGHYVDGTSAEIGWGTVENYRPDHIKYSTLPLGFSYINKKPIILTTFSNYEFLDKFSKALHNRNKILVVNIQRTKGLVMNKIDIVGVEISDIEPDIISSYHRTMSSKKTISTIIQWHWGNDSSIISKDIMNAYVKKSVLYGIFPGISSQGNGYDNIYWHDRSAYERDRYLFKKYVPLIKEISKSGWEPIPYAGVDNSNIILERYGNSRLNKIYFTVLNTGSTANNGILTIDSSLLDNKKIRGITELVYGKSKAIVIENGKIKLDISIDPNDVKIYKLSLA